MRPTRPALAAGGTLILDTRGNVWGFEPYKDDWGTSVEDVKPKQMKGLSRIAAIQPGIALHEHGSVYVWGPIEDNKRKVIWHSKHPVKLPGIDDATAVASVGSSFLILRKDGGVWGIGATKSDKIGLRRERGVPIENVLKPRKLKFLEKPIVRISGASRRALALSTDGTVYAFLGPNALVRPREVATWYEDDYGALQFDAGNDVCDVVTGVAANFLIRKDGSVWEWGKLYTGSTPDESTGSVPRKYVALPRKALGFEGVVSLSANASVLALKGDGTLWARGDNSSGHVGLGPDVKFVASPVHIPIPKTIASISSGETAVGALDEAGQLWLWGGIVAPGSFEPGAVPEFRAK